MLGNRPGYAGDRRAQVAFGFGSGGGTEAYGQQGLGGVRQGTLAAKYCKGSARMGEPDGYKVLLLDVPDTAAWSLAVVGRLQGTCRACVGIFGHVG